MKNRIIIVGGSGFLGRATIDLLSKNDFNNIVVLDILKPNFTDVDYQYCDISKGVDFDFNESDIVIHLAARQYHLAVPKKNVLDFFCEVNVNGTKNVLEKMQKCNCKNMIYFSTDMVYGLPNFLPVSVNHPQEPIGEYGQSKKLSEAICRKFRQKGFNITIFRPRMIVGKGRLGILVKLFKLIKFNLPVPMIGSGNNFYQMVSVNDCASAILLAIDKNIPNLEFNLGSKNPPKVKVLMKSLIKSNNSKSILIPTWGWAVKTVIKFLSLLSIRIMYKEQYSIADVDYIVSIKEAEDALGWVPSHSDSDMLSDAFNDYLNK